MASKILPNNSYAVWVLWVVKSLAASSAGQRLIVINCIIIHFLGGGLLSSYIGCYNVM